MASVVKGQTGRLVPDYRIYNNGVLNTMGSLKYEIAQRCKELMQTETSAGGKQATEKSWRTYLDAAVKYGEWCKRTYRCRHFVDCREHIQAYSDWLVEQGKSASTIHTYLAGVCRVYEVPLDKVQKPKRVTSQNTRSRGRMTTWTTRTPLYSSGHRVQSVPAA